MKRKPNSLRPGKGPAKKKTNRDEYHNLTQFHGRKRHSDFSYGIPVTVDVLTEMILQEPGLVPWEKQMLIFSDGIPVTVDMLTEMISQEPGLVPWEKQKLIFSYGIPVTVDVLTEMNITRT